MEIGMRRKMYRKPMMDEHRMWRTKAIAGLTCEPVMSMGMGERMVTVRIQMRRKKHCKPMIDQRRMWSTEGIVLESVKIGQYISYV
jgi:hypothetical protein